MLALPKIQRSHVVTRTALSLLALAALSSTACKKDDPPPATAQQPQPYAGGYQQQPGGYPQQQPGAYPQQQPGGYPQQQPGGYPQQQPGQQPGAAPGQQPGAPGQQPGQPGGQPGAQPGGLPPFPGLPGGQQGGQTTSGGTAQAIDPNLAGLAAGPLAIYAGTEAPGMNKEGGPVAGNFQPGQTIESGFTFQPGKCYTLVAQAAGPTQIEVEMQYVTPLPGLAPSIGKSTQKGAQVSIGGKANCLRPLSPLAAQAKYIVRAVQGSGLIAAQLYSK
jgi:hypothetical protein